MEQGVAVRHPHFCACNIYISDLEYCTIRTAYIHGVQGASQVLVPVPKIRGHPRDRGKLFPGLLHVSGMKFSQIQ